MFFYAEPSSIVSLHENLAAPIAHSLFHGAFGIHTLTTNYIFLEQEFHIILLFTSCLVRIQQWKVFDKFSVTCYTIVHNLNCWAMGNVYQFFGVPL